MYEHIIKALGSLWIGRICLLNQGRKTSVKFLGKIPSEGFIRSKKKYNQFTTLYADALQPV